ncbi:MAG: Rrf2 family transcriptional regulator [Pseudomonadaceae bacterium]|nr:Rrf2 family transcriptional regulator [Pseudomonadaceae bacterium]
MQFKKRFAALLLVGTWLASGYVEAEVLTLGDATQKALAENPLLNVYALRKTAIKARREVAALRPGFELGIEAENFVGTDTLGRIDEAEITVKDIAARYNVSRNHLVKVVHRLSSLEYLESTQGRGGGIALAMAPEDILVGDVVRNMEVTLDVIDCAAGNCPLLPACLLKGALDEATDAFLDTLDGYTIADLTKNRSAFIKLVGS